MGRSASRNRRKRRKTKRIKKSKIIDPPFSRSISKGTDASPGCCGIDYQKDGEDYHFMDSSNFEQISIQKKLIDHPKFLTDGLEVDILIHAEKGDILNCELPLSIETKIIYTEPSVKGDTATNATKNAKIETGEEIQVPLFINKNDKIKVDTKQGKYIERVK